MKRFVIIERGGYKEENERRERIVEYIVLKDKKTNRIIKLEYVSQRKRTIDIDDYDATVNVYIGDKEPISFDPIDRTWEWSFNTRGQRRRQYASICRYLGISKKELTAYLGLVSLFD